MHEETIPLLLLVIGIFTVLCLFLITRYRAKRDIQETIRKALEQGQPLAPDTIKALGASITPDPRLDLKRGLLLGFIGLAVLVFAQLLPDAGEAREVFTAFSVFPIFLGLGFYVYYLLNTRRQNDN